MASIMLPPALTHFMMETILSSNALSLGMTISTVRYCLNGGMSAGSVLARSTVVVGTFMSSSTCFIMASASSTPSWELSTSIRFVARCPMMAFWAGMASLRAMYFKVNFVAP